MNSSWAMEEVGSAPLGDKRLSKRLVRLLDALAARPNASVPQALGSWSQTKAFYRFCSNERILPNRIVGAHFHSTNKRARAYKRVLALQDTTLLDLTDHPHTKGLGPLLTSDHQGVMMHSVLVGSDEGVPLGVLYQQIWARDAATRGKSREWRKRPIEEKESIKWLYALSDTQAYLPEEVAIVSIGDREADLFDLFVRPRRAGHDLLIRAAYNRRLVCEKPEDPEQAEPRLLEEALSQAGVCGTHTFTLRRHEDKPARSVTLTLRYARVTLQPPAYRADLAPVSMVVLLAEEENPPKGIEPLRWVLLTTLPIGGLEDVVQCLRWYACRWLVERYHFVLQSGCRVEELQLQTYERLCNALEIYAIVAWRLLWLTYEARRNPTQSCERALDPAEWKALYAIVHQTTDLPSDPPSLQQAVLWIARLGGFLARKGDGEPGVKTLWRGLQRLHDITQAFKLFNDKSYG